MMILIVTNFHAYVHNCPPPPGLYWLGYVPFISKDLVKGIPKDANKQPFNNTAWLIRQAIWTNSQKKSKNKLRNKETRKR